MKKNILLAICIAYYALLAYVCANVMLTHIHIKPLEAAIFGPLLMRHLVSLLLAVALAAILTHKESFRTPLVPVFSLILSGILGLTMVGSYATQTPLNKWVLICILFLSSLFLEWQHHTLSWWDALEDIAFSYTLAGMFFELIGWGEIPIVSWDAFLASAFFGLIQVWLATHCHTPKAAPEAASPQKVKPIKKPNP